MTFYRVRSPQGATTWVAYVDEELRVWTYVQNTRRFHLNDGVFLDFMVEHRSCYQRIDADAVRREISHGTGTLHPRRNAFLVRKFESDPAALTPGEVFARAALRAEEGGEGGECGV